MFAARVVGAPVDVELYFPMCVFLLVQDLVQGCLRGGGGRVEDMCYERRRAEAGVDSARL